MADSDYSPDATAFGMDPVQFGIMLTVDDGEEFVAHKAITAELKSHVYFAQEHSRWERPTNKNMNGL